MPNFFWNGGSIIFEVIFVNTSKITHKNDCNDENDESANEYATGDTSENHSNSESSNSREYEDHQNDENGNEYATGDTSDHHSSSDSEIDITLPRRSTRIRKPVQRLNLLCMALLYMNNASMLPTIAPVLELRGFACTVFDQEPKNHKEAMTRPDASEWRKAEILEKESMERTNTWKLVKRSQIPKDASVLPCITVYKIKQLKDGTVDKYKVRVCAGGHKQTHGVDYLDTFAPVVRFTTIRLVIALATIMN